MRSLIAGTFIMLIVMESREPLRSTILRVYRGKGIELLDMFESVLLIPFNPLRTGSATALRNILFAICFQSIRIIEFYFLISWLEKGIARIS